MAAPPASPRAYDPPSLVTLAALTAAEHPQLILADPAALGTMGEDLAALLLGVLVRRGRMTRPLAIAFRGSGHAGIAAFLSGWDIDAPLMAAAHVAGR